MQHYGTACAGVLCQGAGLCAMPHLQAVRGDGQAGALKAPTLLENGRR